MNELQNQGELKRTLSLPLLIGFGLAYLAPTVVFNYYGIWTADSGTGGHYPLALLIATVLMTFTAYSYTRMVKEYPTAGSAYVYVNKSVQPHIGFLTGWVMLLDYLLLPMVCYLLIGIYVNEYFPALPVWVIVVGCAALGAIFNIVGVKTASIIDSIIIAAQIIFTIVTIILCIMYVCGTDGLSLLSSRAIVNPDTFDTSAVLNAAAILCVSFVGFDAVTTMAEETKDPDKVMTPAIMGVCVGAGIMFFITAYALNVAWPDAHTGITDPDVGIYEFYPAIGYGWAADVFFVVDEFASFVCAMAGMGAVSRILLGMGRDNILPKKFFGSVSKKWNTPVKNIILVSIIGCSGIFYADNLIGAAELVSFGCILGFIMVNLSVVLHFYKHKGLREGAKNKLMYLIVPGIGAVALAIAFIFVGTGAKILGCIWLLIGLIYLAVKTKGFKELPPEMTFEE
ncbi:MAG: APC family permease [Clostridiales bacterium]|nr:APC family permease [Clostridiales bacterium]MBQ3323147.1 APC family permease [Bacillota bacterium]